MRPKPPQVVRDALHAELAPVVVERVKSVLMLAAGTVGISIVVDLQAQTPGTSKILLTKLVGMCLYACGAVVVMSMPRANWRRTLWVSVPAACLLTVVPSAIAVSLGDPLVAAFILALVTLGGAVIFPWGPAAHSCLLAMATVSLTMTLWIAGQVTPNLVMVVISAFVAGAYAADAMERQRLERKAADLRQVAQQRVLERLAADAPLDVVFTTICDGFAQEWPAAHASILLVDEQNACVRVLRSINLPDPFAAALDGLPIDPSRTPSAPRSFARIPQHVTANGEERWSRLRAIAAECGFAACWSEPIRSPDGTVLGTLALYDEAPREPASWELAIVDSTVGLASIALERERSRRQLASYVEELARARDDALASTRAKSEFLANMSHEIRTPMNGVIGMTDILLDTPMSEEQKEYAYTIRRCSDSLLTVINDILDFSKIEAGKMTIERVDLDLRIVIEEVADLLAPKANEKNVELAAVIPPNFPGLVQGDPSRLRQVLTNLLGNAIKFTERGEVTIVARVLADRPEELEFELGVRDTGIGIAADRIDAIFESFTQVDGSSTRRHGGTGLGLTICRQLVHLMGGTIGVESAVGAGSTFWVRLTLPKQTGGPAEPAPPPAVLHGVHVLVVDDNATNRLILREQLRAWGCRPVDVGSGDEAIATLRQALDDDPFGIVILDMQMPEMDGQTTARLIRRNPRLAGTPLVLLSSIGLVKGGVEAVRAMGFDAGLSKPVRQSQLCDLLVQVLAGRPDERTIVKTPSSALPADAPLRALIVEDNPVNQKVAQRMLETLGCQCDSVTNGLEALESLGRAFYDLVIMDVQMPVMDGISATKEIRRRESTGSRIAIIAMTAHAMQGDRDRCLAAGMDDYVAKPVSRDAFRQALARCGTVIAARRRGMESASAEDLPPVHDAAFDAIAAELDRGGQAQSLADAQEALEKARRELERMRTTADGRAPRVDKAS